MKLISKELQYAEILKLSVDKQDEMALAFVKTNARVKATKDEQKEGAKVIGKLLCALEIRMDAGKKASVIAPNVTLKDYFKTQYGEAPQTHPLSLKNAFGAYVLTGFITENDYDNNSGNCLELAARIVTAVNGDLANPAVKLASAQLAERSNKEAANLREILASVKPAEKMTAEEALEHIQEIMADGHLSLVISHIPDLASVKVKQTVEGVETSVETIPDSVQREIYLALGRSFNRLDAAIPTEKTAAWSIQAEASTAPVQLITAEAA